MGNTLTIKVHNVLHKPNAIETTERVEQYIEQHSDPHDRVTNIRIAKGRTNSPIFIDIEAHSLNLMSIKRICRDVVRMFGWLVSGVDVDATITDDNLLVK